MRKLQGGFYLSEHHFTIFLSTFLFFLSLLPSVYLRYLPFHAILTPKTKQRLLQGYTVIFFSELTITLLLFYTDTIPYSFHTFKIFYAFFGYLPYILLNLCMIRPYLTQHIFIFGIQMILAATVSHISIALVVFFTGMDSFFQYFSFYCALYIAVYLLLFPFVLPFFRQIFLRFSSVSTDRFWLYICPLPHLILFHDLYFSSSKDLLILEHLIPRLLLFTSGIFLALAAWRGLEHVLQQTAATERNLDLLTRMHSIGEYTRSLKEKQERLAIVRHDLRHNAQMLANLISCGEDESAIRLIQNMNTQIDETRVEHFAKHPLFDAALTIYVKQMRQKEIPIEVKMDIPTAFAAEVDLSLVFCNLLENAIHAEEHEPQGARAIRVLARSQKDRLFLSIENRCSQPVPLDANGLPISRTPAPGHGYGTRTLQLFAEKYDAEFFTEQKNGWFQILLHLSLDETKEA